MKSLQALLRAIKHVERALIGLEKVADKIDGMGEPKAKKAKRGRKKSVS